MKMTLRYQNTPDVVIKSLAVVGAFNDYNPNFGKMTLEGDYWTFELNGTPGEHPYRFIINNALEIIDPESGFFYVDDNNKLWSLLYVNEVGERMYNTMDSSIHIERYHMYNKITTDPIEKSKKSFNVMLDKEVCVKFEFTEIMGLHNASIVWFSPLGDVLHLEEYPVYTEGTDANEVHLWSTFSIVDFGKKYPVIGWRVNLFINGEFILEDTFEVHHVTGYSSLGRLK